MVWLTEHLLDVFISLNIWNSNDASATNKKKWSFIVYEYVLIRSVKQKRAYRSMSICWKSYELISIYYCIHECYSVLFRAKPRAYKATTKAFQFISKNFRTILAALSIRYGNNTSIIPYTTNAFWKKEKCFNQRRFSNDLIQSNMITWFHGPFETLIFYLVILHSEFKILKY